MVMGPRKARKKTLHNLYIYIYTCIRNFIIHLHIIILSSFFILFFSKFTNANKLQSILDFFEM